METVAGSQRPGFIPVARIIRINMLRQLPEGNAFNKGKISEIERKPTRAIARTNFPELDER